MAAAGEADAEDVDVEELVPDEMLPKVSLPMKPALPPSFPPTPRRISRASSGPRGASKLPMRPQRVDLHVGDGVAAVEPRAAEEGRRIRRRGGQARVEAERGARGRGLEAHAEERVRPRGDDERGVRGVVVGNPGAARRPEAEHGMQMKIYLKY